MIRAAIIRLEKSMFRTFVSALIIILTTITAKAQSADPERLALARAYLENVQNEATIKELIKNSSEPFLERIRATQPIVYSEKEDKIRELTESILLSVAKEVNEGMDLIVATTFSLDEIKALKEFSDSDIGKSVLAKMPELGVAIQPKMQSAMTRALPELFQSLQQEGISLR